MASPLADKNVIVTATDPRGVHIQGVIDDPGGLGILPGTHVQIKAGVTPDEDNRLTWEVYNVASDGKPRAICVVKENYPSGQTPDKAYEDGEIFFGYIPAMGETCNIRVGKAGTGTTDAIGVGDILMLDDGTGVAIADSSGDRKPWQAVEHASEVVSMTAGGSLVNCMYTGN